MVSLDRHFCGWPKFSKRLSTYLRRETCLWTVQGKNLGYYSYHHWSSLVDWYLQIWKRNFSIWHKYLKGWDILRWMSSINASRKKMENGNLVRFRLQSLLIHWIRFPSRIKLYAAPFCISSCQEIINYRTSIGWEIAWLLSSCTSCKFRYRLL